MNFHLFAILAQCVIIHFNGVAYVLPRKHISVCARPLSSYDNCHFLRQSVNNIDYPIMTTINHSSYEIN